VYYWPAAPFMKDKRDWLDTWVDLYPSDGVFLPNAGGPHGTWFWNWVPVFKPPVPPKRAVTET
jgi:hypothetical protein